jgi:hypothetical protein
MTDQASRTDRGVEALSAEEDDDGTLTAWTELDWYLVGAVGAGLPAIAADSIRVLARRVEAEAAARTNAALVERVEGLETAVRGVLPLAVRSMGGYAPFGPRLPEPNGEIFQADKRAIERARAVLTAAEPAGGTTDDVRAEPGSEQFWMDEARRYAANADYWRERAERAGAAEPAGEQETAAGPEFYRQAGKAEAEQRCADAVGRIVAAAGGEVRVPDRLVVGDVTMSVDYLAGETVYRAASQGEGGVTE